MKALVLMGGINVGFVIGLTTGEDYETLFANVEFEGAMTAGGYTRKLPGEVAAAGDLMLVDTVSPVNVGQKVERDSEVFRLSV